MRTRDVVSFGWAFTLLNLVGISLLAVRSWEINEPAFVTINLVTATFWLLVASVKLVARRRDVGQAAPTTPRAPPATLRQ